MKTITAAEVKKKLEKDEILLIDVREPVEHKSGAIDGACLIPLKEISVEKLPSRSRPIVIHCKSGKRSVEACTKLLKQDSSIDVVSLDGGIIAWQTAGFNIKKSNNILPIERQTHITVGFFALFGTIMGTFYNPYFYFLPGIIGTGLIFAGVTGWCGMAKLLSRMPWNR